MAIYYTGILAGNQVNFTTGDATVLASDVKQYFIEQSLTGGTTGTAPSNKAVYDFTTGVSGYISGQINTLNNATGLLSTATGTISSWTGTIGSAAFRDLANSIADGGTGVPTSDVVFDFSTGLSGFLYLNAGGLYEISALSTGTDVAAINLTGRVSGTSFIDSVQISGGNAIDLSVSSDIIRIDHTDTSSVADITVNAAAGSAITGVSFTFDTYGHVLTATGTSAVIVRDQIQSGVTATAPSENAVYGLSGTLRPLIDQALGRDLQSVTNSGNSTTNGINIGGDLVVSGNTILGSDASDSVTVKSGPVVLEAATGSGDALIFGANNADKVSVYKSDPNVLRVDGALIVTGNLIVQGTTTTIESNTVTVGDSIIVLNNDFTGPFPSENAGIDVERGGLNNTTLLWNEGTDRWTFTNDGTNYYNLPLTSELTIDAVTTNGASTANDVVLGGLTISGAAQAKSDHLVLYCTTTDATTTEMFLNGTNGRIGLASNTAATFKGDITAFDSANAKAASWSYNCLVANKAGNTAIVGAAHVVKLGDDSGGTWEVYVDADNPNDSLKLQVKGQASSTIKWTASVISSVVS